MNFSSTPWVISATYTHRSDEDLLLGPPGLAQDCADLPRTGCAEGMAEGDGAASGVDLCVVEAEYVQTVDSHGGKGLVDLEDIDIVLGKLELLQELRDGGGWADTHNPGWDTSYGGTAELG